MALLGDLETFALADVLRLLSATAKTGCLYIDADRGTGKVWLHEGELLTAQATATSASGVIDEVLFELLRCDRGSFRFNADEAVPEELELPDHEVNLEAALLGARQLLQEWQDLREVVASLDCHVTLQPELDADEVTIGASAWPTLGAIGPGATVAQIAERLRLGEIDVMRRVSEVRSSGLVTIWPPAAARSQRRTRRVPTGPATGDTVQTDQPG